MRNKPKFFLITTVSVSLVFFKGQISILKNEFDVHLVSSPDDNLNVTSKREKVKSHSISMEREISLFKDLKGLFQFIFLFIKERPNVIHCNTPKGAFLSLVAGYITKVPKRIYFVHGLRYQGANGLKRKVLMFMEKTSCYFATDVIAVSDGVRKVLNREVTNKAVELIGFGSSNGIDLDSFDRNNYNKEEIRLSLDISKDDFVFGFVGRLVGDKGINELVHSFKKISKDCNNTKLVLIGGFENQLDPLKQETLNEIKTNKQIIYLGIQSDVKPFLSIINVFTFPSYREGFGMSLMEANAMGVPAISSNITGCNEIVIEGVSGFLIKPKNEFELFEKMKYCITNKSLIETMSLNCRNSISLKFSQKIFWKKALVTYLSILNR